MKVLFDHSTPKPLLRCLPQHECKTAAQMGWQRLNNGDLLKACEQAGFDVMVTCDRNLRYQQNLTGRRIDIVEITTNDWALIKPHQERIAAAVDAASCGSYAVVAITLPPKAKRRPPR